MFIHLRESHVNSAPSKAAVGWYQVTAEKMTRQTQNMKKSRKINPKQGHSIVKLLGRL